MTLHLFAIGIILLSMSKSFFQAFAEAAGPLGTCLILKSVEIHAKSDSMVVLVNSHDDVFALGDRDFAGGESYYTMTME